MKNSPKKFSQSSKTLPEPVWDPELSVDPVQDPVDWKSLSLKSSYWQTFNFLNFGLQAREQLMEI